MNRPTFDHTVSILVKAYFNDELAHGFCSACAVGNIVAHHIGTKPKRFNNPEGMWRGKQTDPTWMFNGLMTVVDVLAQIHNVDLSTKEQAKLLFVK